MKQKTIRRISTATLSACALLMAACSGTTTSGTTNTTQAVGEVSNAKLNFVAADKTNWDKEITIGDYTYKLEINFFEDGTLQLDGVCTGRPEVETGNGQQGGGMGGFASAPETEEPTEAAPTTAAMTEDEKAAQNFTKTGTWEYEAGYGYTVTIDGYTTKTDYDKPSARQVFYMEIMNNGASSGLVEFQGKDTGFRSEIAADYEIFEARDAAYSFSGTGTTGNGNASTIALYLEEDGQANAIGSQGSTPTYKRGSWTENADKSLTLEIDGSVYSVDYCDVAGKEGYRVTYSSTTMYTSVSGENISYTDEDFNGATLLTMYCAEGDYELSLTEKGFAILNENGALASMGKFTQDGDAYTVVIDGNTYVSEGNELFISFEKEGQSSNTETVERTFNVDGTKPEGAVPAEGGNSQEGEAPAEGDAEGGNSQEGEAPAEGDAEGGNSQEGEAPEEGGNSQEGETPEAPAQG